MALGIDEPLRERLLRLSDELRPLLRGARFVRSEGIHLTLRFLGETSQAQAAALCEALAPAARACPPCEVATTGLGLFPERGSPRVLWVGLVLPASVLELQRACEAGAAAAGFPRETRAFAAHLTLARWRDRTPRPTLPAVELGAAALRELALMRSELRRGGAVYTPVARFPLGQP